MNENLFGFEDAFVFGSGWPLVLMEPFAEKSMELPWRKEVAAEILNVLRVPDLGKCTDLQLR